MRPGHAPARQQRLRFAALHSSLHFSRRFRANALTGRQQRAGRVHIVSGQQIRAFLPEPLPAKAPGGRHVPAEIEGGVGREGSHQNGKSDEIRIVCSSNDHRDRPNFDQKPAGDASAKLAASVAQSDPPSPRPRRAGANARVEGRKVVRAAGERGTPSS